MGRVQISRRHHILPRFYLERFASEAGQLTQVWLPGDRSHLISVNDATVETDFYSISTHDGSLDDFWERQFSVTEGLAQAAFREVVDERHWPPSESARRAIAEWVALQYLRSNALRRQISDHRSAIIRLQTGVGGVERLRRVMEAGLGRPVADDELEAEWGDLTKPGGTHLLTDVRDHIELLVDLIGPTAQLLFDSGWVIVRFDRKRLWTSDSPVSLRSAASDSLWTGVGLATADSYLVPLSRFDGLMITVGNPGDLEHMGTTAIAKLFNFDTSNNARKFVLHHPDDTDIVSVVPLHAPIEREISTGDDDHFVDREGWASHFGASGMPNSLAGGDGGGATIPDYVWPIPGRTFVNPHAPTSDG